MPGDDVRVDVGIRAYTGSSDLVRVELWDLKGKVVMVSEQWELNPVEEKYEASKESLSTHEAPRWVWLFVCSK